MMPRWVIDLILSWRQAFGWSKLAVWQASPRYIMWTSRRERNYRTFEDEEKLMQDIKSSFMRTLFEYRTMIEGVSCNYLVEFLDHMAVHL